MTICVKCEHFYTREADRNAGGTWYQTPMCRKKKTITNPVTGEKSKKEIDPEEDNHGCCPYYKKAKNKNTYKDLYVDIEPLTIKHDILNKVEQVLAFLQS